MLRLVLVIRSEVKREKLEKVIYGVVELLSLGKGFGFYQVGQIFVYSVVFQLEVLLHEFFKDFLHC